MSIVDRLFPDENAKPEQIRSWRKVIGLVSIVTFFSSAFYFGSMFGGWPVVGHLVWSKDLDQAVQDKIGQTNQRVEKLEKQIEQQTKISEKFLVRATEEQIDFLLRRRCKARDSEEFDYLSREIKKYVDEWEDLKKKEYRAPTCRDLEFQKEVVRN